LTLSQSADESAFDSVMIGFAVPERRKSASLTELVKASCMAMKSSSSATSWSSGHDVKCSISLKGRDVDVASVESVTGVKGSAGEYRSYNKPMGTCHFNGTSSKENQPQDGLVEGSMRDDRKNEWSLGSKRGKYDRRGHEICADDQPDCLKLSEWSTIRDTDRAHRTFDILRPPR